MSKESAAKGELPVLVRLLKASLLVCALVCALITPPTASSGEPRRSAAFEGEDGVIAFSANGEIYVISAGEAKKVVGGENGGANRHPAISPDGKLIAFSSSREGHYSIYIVGVDGVGLWRLTYGYLDDSEPAWSPDGSKIAFVRGADGTTEGYANMSTCASEIYVIDVPNILSGGVTYGGEESLTRGLGGTDPAWSPDGTRIAFSSYRDGNYELYTMGPDGENVIRLTNTNSDEGEPAWSPDGSSLAYVANLVRVEENCGWMSTPVAPGPGGGGTPSIYVMTVGRNRRWQVSGSAGATDPTWSPDGTHVAFVGVASGDGQLYSAEAASGLQTQLTFDATWKSSPSWSR